ncbi:MAG: hypothetical protein A2275_07125 [Bacteroidetes bacterium RIFOXYA12_FULL_35_11]|nr:MAG: hypothetical protein A2X01_04520 [Bacteroidetes bacterium GWF2_35_48]OFY83195.1 MAG: hypothetical protein A2275_07125 [Bacteroidetes bacterium RIFOXYA12_FULL_35_11]OFY96219.1 MAG: hypothetical protein A2491_16120 [Bacteroidetes bacterium RIFOXYC12_FULL_35_7]OFY97047.1 MAG: hypothetical protein A2309_00615 [Bacteroidetes bacterium RIFOXYB2_FULL_35_7]HBX53276.1 hypothetical protein [Bacteroidales bacterium]
MANKLKKNKAVLINNPEFETGHNKLFLLRVILHPEFTKVDFGYQAPYYYERGGWVRISPETFIRDRKNDNSYKMTRAEGICLAPEKFEFKSNQDFLYFSIFFVPIPNNISHIDFIEEEPDNGTNFNFYNIVLNNPASRVTILS